MSDNKICPLCEKEMTGCPCGHRKAEDGKLVHGRCLNKYNYILKQKKENQNGK